MSIKEAIEIIEQYNYLIIANTYESTFMSYAPRRINSKYFYSKINIKNMTNDYYFLRVLDRYLLRFSTKDLLKLAKVLKLQVFQ